MGTINLQSDGAVARIVIAAPERRNAMSLAMWTQLRAIVVGVAADPRVRVIVLRGDGDKAFVSGADISEFGKSRADARSIDSYDQAVSAAQEGLMDCPLPIIASIRGVCMGGGMGLALACDLRYATATTRFRMPAARLGIGYRLDGIRRFIDVIGAARTADLFYTARIFDGSEAARYGLVHAAYADDELDAAVEQVVASIAENAPLTVRAVKRAINVALGAPPAPGDAADVARLVAACMTSTDYVEGRTAFSEKRPPRFTGS